MRALFPSTSTIVTDEDFEEIIGAIVCAIFILIIIIPKLLRKYDSIKINRMIKGHYKQNEKNKINKTLNEEKHVGEPAYNYHGFVLDNVEVMHCKYGKGVISSINPKIDRTRIDRDLFIINVNFFDYNGLKNYNEKFLFPKCIIDGNITFAYERDRNSFNTVYDRVQESRISKTNFSIHVETKEKYEKNELLSNYEKKLYAILNKTCSEKDWTIISKVRLADLIKTKTKDKNDFYKISSKHIDFALCRTDDLEPMLLIELDDNSHNRDDRRSRDDFVNQSVVESGYKILHVRHIDDELQDRICKLVEDSFAGVYYY